MAKKKNYWYVLVMTEEGPKFVTEVNYSDKTAEWNMLETPREFNESMAKDLVIELNLNFNVAYAVCQPFKLTGQPYRYADGKLTWVENEKDRTESEPQELEQEPKWIPVSERLPEDDDYRPCTNHEWNDNAVLYCTDKGIIGLGWYYYSTKCWANLDDRWFERDGQVVAWMPLPKPYEPQESEDKNELCRM